MHAILIVEDDPHMSARLARVCAQLEPPGAPQVAASLAQARARLDAQAFQWVLLDIGLPDGSGLELLPWLQQHAPGTDAVVISSLGDDATVLAAIRAGAVGYLQKNGSDVELALSLGSMQRGGAPIDPVIARRILNLVAAGPAPEGVVPKKVTVVNIEPETTAAKPVLSERELDVLRLVAQGHTNREIAQGLGLSVHTIECHAKNIYRKLAVRSRAGAVYTARSRGLLP
ncbi:MAG: response regulator transcription factor [Proteobacteria bacterium]|nr:response regulator transcription factor [Pseudomonadota bacterium]